MKKIIFATLAALMLVIPASAQYYPNGRPIPPRHRNYGTRSWGSYGFRNYTYYGFRIGMGVSTVNSDSPALDANSSKTGLNAGFVIGTQIAPMAPLFFESGLYYTEKGGKSSYEGSKFTYSLNYLELPLLLKYKVYTSSGVSVEPFAGGYLACGISGKMKDYKQREAYSAFSDDFKRFDGGLKIGCGVGFQMLYAEASYDIGLANIGKDDFDDTKNGCFNLTLGVNF